MQILLMKNIQFIPKKWLDKLYINKNKTLGLHNMI